ncbi:hypothetical protein [Kitasatospora sp. SUK 42]|uniref:hypothetical protein n=1 Tax=Kitasatospora sp. SUK 42 TaxID=1588882 RepID=UPI0018C8FDE3|nr:hypothetical protein [Kitasatospora sp. SUK 42]MBV2155109.1 hypothetical protein [Kitasatospora sp. SUK 42]
MVLSQAAPASARWIVDGLSRPDEIPDSCPVPALTGLIVLDDAIAHSRAAVAWLGDGEMVCLAVVRNNAGSPEGITAGASLGSLSDQRDPVWFDGWAIFTVFPGDAGKVVIKDDDDHLFGPVHQRVVDLGGGREFTIVEYADDHPDPYAPDPSTIPSARAQVCPSAGGECRPARWISPPAAPAPTADRASAGSP